MEFSLDMPNLDHQFNAPAHQIPDVSFRKSVGIMDNDIIDLSQIVFEDDENWLCESSNQTVNLRQWLNSSRTSQDDLISDLPEICDFKSDLQKTIDSRTFTRPKKRYNRPSIEKYNEEIYGTDSTTQKLTDSGIQMNEVLSTDISPSNLVFDLAQPANSHYFDNILANAPMLDSFTNMSPPSLVNSMCSSTFANLMESSFIKNDPVLREIRDTDYTETILLQDTEPIMFQSITGSCSSLNSDITENFLKKLSVNETIKNHQEETHDEQSTKINTAVEEQTFLLPENFDSESENFKENHIENINGTYQRKSRTKSTFRVADVNNGTINLNHTFQRRKNKSSTPLISTNMTDNIDLTYARDLSTNDLVETKRLLDRRPVQPSLDLNRLSYLADDNFQDAVNTTYDNKRNSFGSTDSSVSSGSSSHQMLNIDRVHHIAEMQERSLGQIMSTPKPGIKKATAIWENTLISPISGRNSDPELSSSDKHEFKQPMLIGSSQITKQKSLGQINSKLAPPKSIGTINKISPPSIRGSHPNLNNLDGKSVQRTTTHSKLVPAAGTTGSRTNLNSMGRTLKGSYTSLRPTNVNLPVAPPLDGTITVPKTVNVTQIIKDAQPESNTTQVIKPARTSGLPRPSGTGIPRPVSRIPGPRNIRGIPKPTGQQSTRQVN